MAGPIGGVRKAFLNVREAAEYLGLSPHTLYVWRHRRQGPPELPHGPTGPRHVPAGGAQRLGPYTGTGRLAL
ncbi:helix-turn-helix domain-containing protein [Streptomyces netropsis]|uniref:helix-turn-helix domain-containing protein n=1 Tax=Streptomyces netropsis TaxID=55404 RepID=UPI0030CA9A7D